MTMHAIARRGPWIDLVEAIHAPAVDDAAWAAPIIDGARELFPRAAIVGLYVLEHAPDLSLIRLRFNAPDAATAMMGSAVKMGIDAGPSAFAPAHFGPPVLTHLEAERRAPPCARGAMDQLRKLSGLADGVGIVAHPAPGIVAVLHAIFESPVDLQPYERRLLSRVAMHLENSYRVRQRPEDIRAVLTTEGKILYLAPDAPERAALANEASRVSEARSAKLRTSGEALDLWTALVAGHVSIVPRTENGRTTYAVLENPPAARSIRALSSSESAVLALAARGLSTKLVAYALGITPARVSERMATAASKIGTMSRAELVRIAAMLTGDPRSELPVDALSDAEKDVLDLLERGLSNGAIAALRSRSLRTIANQVASILRKTGRPSRRALIAAPSARAGTG